MIEITALEKLPPNDFVNELAIWIYDPSFEGPRENLGNLPEPLRVFILVIDFDSEVAMDGMLGFLENSTGRYLAETIDALESIGAHVSATTLREIEGILEKYGVTHASLREKIQTTAHDFLVASFSEVHGVELDEMAEEIEKKSQWFTCDDTGDEPIRRLLGKYVAQNRSAILDALKLSLEITNPPQLRVNNPN